ncbi:MAG: holo-ACP synthase [Acidobacteriota bacterium]
MIKGTGADIIAIDRIKKAISKDDKFTDKIFSEVEVEYCNSKFRKEIHFAGRFAAKEAFFKALGTGWRDGMKWTEIIVVNDELGKPEIRILGKTEELFKELGMEKINLSISHTKEFAVAFVIIE